MVTKDYTHDGWAGPKRTRPRHTPSPRRWSRGWLSSSGCHGRCVWLAPRRSYDPAWTASRTRGETLSSGKMNATTSGRQEVPGSEVLGFFLNFIQNLIKHEQTQNCVCVCVRNLIIVLWNFSSRYYLLQSIMQSAIIIGFHNLINNKSISSITS